MDYALSFQDPDGCSEVWNFIAEVQRIHASTGGAFRPPSPCISFVYMVYAPEDQRVGSSSPYSGPEPSITTASIIRSGHLPHPALGIISEIDKAIKTLSRTNAIREKICEYIQRAVRHTFGCMYASRC